MSSRSTRLLRSRDGGGSRVTFIELFFDLVYVFAITQLSTHLSRHLTLGGAFETLLLLVAVWWAWIDTAWVTNWFDPDHLAVRILLLAVMLASLVMSAALPAAFSDRGLVFASAYSAIQVGRVLFVVIALGRQELGRNFQRILAWRALAGVLWLAGGLGQGTVRIAFWVAAVGVDVAAAAVGFATPGLGRSRTTEWTIEGGHLAERCQLFILIALGESILAIGATLAGLSLSLAAAAAFVVTFVGSVALWWIYFDRNAERAGQAIAATPDPGRLGRSAYTYFHLPMVGGIIVSAVAAELTIAEPFQHGAAATTLTILGGPWLFLAGHALFKRAVWGRLSWPRIIAMVVLACLVPAAALVPVLMLELAAVLVIGAVAAWETYARPPLAGVSAPGTGPARRLVRRLLGYRNARTLADGRLSPPVRAGLHREDGMHLNRAPAVGGGDLRGPRDRLIPILALQHPVAVQPQAAVLLRAVGRGRSLIGPDLDGEGGRGGLNRVSAAEDARSFDVMEQLAVIGYLLFQLRGSRPG